MIDPAQDASIATDALAHALAGLEPERVAAIMLAVDARVVARLREAERRLRVAQEAGGVGTYEVSLETGHTIGTPVFYRVLGLPADQQCLTYAQWVALIHPDDRDGMIARLKSMLRDGAEANIVEYRVLVNGEERWVRSCDRIDRNANGRAVHSFGAVHDITHHKQTEARIAHAARHDMLTGLPNRLLFSERLNAMLLSASRAGDMVGLIMIDLDHLKIANDAHGHEAGDLMIRTAGERIAAFAPPQATVARLGGDEFALIAPFSSADALGEIGSEIVRRLHAPLRFGGAVLDCGASAGAALFPTQADGGEALLRNADVALCVAKLSRRGKCLAYAPGLELELRRLSARGPACRLAA